MTVEDFRGVEPRVSRLSKQIKNDSLYFEENLKSTYRISSFDPMLEKKVENIQKHMWLLRPTDLEDEMRLLVGDMHGQRDPLPVTPRITMFDHAYPNEGVTHFPVRRFSPHPREVKFTSLSKVHSRMWVFLVVLALAWGVVTGASFFGGVGLGPSAAAAGFLGTIALAVTMYFVGTRVDEEKREF